jgi:hypothetical protein
MESTLRNCCQDGTVITLRVFLHLKCTKKVNMAIIQFVSSMTEPSTPFCILLYIFLFHYC